MFTLVGVRRDEGCTPVVDVHHAREFAEVASIAERVSGWLEPLIFEVSLVYGWLAIWRQRPDGWERMAVSGAGRVVERELEVGRFAAVASAR